MNHEDLTDSWEDIDYSEVEKTIQKKRDEEMTTTNQNGIETEFKPRIILQRPAQQQHQHNSKVTILKRPQNSHTNLSNSTQNSSKTQIKSLQQREKEYAEARMRILGNSSDSSPTSMSEPNKQFNTGKMSPSSSSNNVNPQPRIPDNLIRQPKGPIANFSGFNNIRR